MVENLLHARSQLTCNAQAFDAPLLRDFEPDQKGTKMAKTGGSRKVRYGMMQDEETGLVKRTFAEV